MSVEATPYYIYEIYKDLEPCSDLFARKESRWTLEPHIVRLPTGLTANAPGVAGLSPKETL